MKQATTFAGIVRQGKPILDNRAGFLRMLGLLEGKRIEISIQKLRKKRSLPQNNWYFGVLIPLMAEHLGVHADDVHRDLKRHFLAVRIDENFARVRSTTELSTDEFSRFMEDCQRLAAEYGVDVPMPNEVPA